MYKIFRDIEVAGVAGATPEEIETVAELMEKADDKVRFVLKRVSALAGLSRRHMCPDDIYASDLAAATGRELLKRLDWRPDSVDSLYVATLSPDFLSPTTANLVADALGLSSRCLNTDVNDGCPGIIHSALLACGLIDENQPRSLVLGGTVLTKEGWKWGDGNYGNRILSGDGFAGFALEYKRGAPPISFYTYTAPDTELALFHDGTGTRYLKTEGRAYSMKGDKVTEFCNAHVAESARIHLEKAGLEIDDIDVFYFHQANKMIVSRLIKDLGITAEKAPMILKDYANCHGASVVMTACVNPTEKKRVRAMFSAFGTGLAVMSMIAEVDTSRIFPIIDVAEPCVVINA